MAVRVLVVDDEKGIREFLNILLKKEGFETSLAASKDEALSFIANKRFDLAIIDLKLTDRSGDTSGLELLRELKEVSPETEVLMVTAYASLDSAVEALKLGAFDYLIKPFKVEEIKILLRKALEQKKLREDHLRLAHELGELKRVLKFPPNLIGSSPKMQRVYSLIRRVAPLKTNVLICGETGTGKKVVARAIHFNSTRSDKPFVTIDCSEIPESLMESELFGHLRGSFTGAVTNKVGLLKIADGGTLFLDEISNIPLNTQAKLLRFIEEQRFRPVGAVKDEVVDVRIIAATNRNLETMVKEGGFRQDLYYRLNVVKIELPPLRERKEDIPLLVQHFIEQYSEELGKNIKHIDPEALKILREYEYEGNVRELENIIEHAVALETGVTIKPSSLPDYIKRAAPAGVEQHALPEGGLDLDGYLADVERRLIIQALERTGGKKTEAARLLGISFPSLRYRMDKLGIETD
ncbi:MAG TPA: sigma-54-dependent Fis family transcriptional regulator [Proteobacteria bacterium]|nr:sigma-54-dependent Fis family transcriptional regulator [Pseudomonadota bacterium]